MMARETINYDHIGKTEYVADVQYRIPLDNPAAVGNRGLEGYDEDTETQRFPTFDAAAQWATTYEPDAGEADYLQIAQIEWVSDTYDDDTYGTILDGVENPIRSWAYDYTNRKWYDL